MGIGDGADNTTQALLLGLVVVVAMEHLRDIVALRFCQFMGELLLAVVDREDCLAFVGDGE